MECVNTEILKKLISSTSKSQNKKSTVQITERLASYLSTTHSLRINSNKWFDGNIILDNFAFEKKRFFNSTDYCTIKENSFKIRTFQRFLKYYDENCCLKRKPFKHAMTIKFQNLSFKK